MIWLSDHVSPPYLDYRRLTPAQSCAKVVHVEGDGQKQSLKWALTIRTADEISTSTTSSEILLLVSPPASNRSLQRSGCTQFESCRGDVIPHLLSPS